MAIFFVELQELEDASAKPKIKRPTFIDSSEAEWEEIDERILHFFQQGLEACLKHKHNLGML